MNKTSSSQTIKLTTTDIQPTNNNNSNNEQQQQQPKPILLKMQSGFLQTTTSSISDTTNTANNNNPLQQQHSKGSPPNISIEYNNKKSKNNNYTLDDLTLSSRVVVVLRTDSTACYLFGKENGLLFLKYRDKPIMKIIILLSKTCCGLLGTLALCEIGPYHEFIYISLILTILLLLNGILDRSRHITRLIMSRTQFWIFFALFLTWAILFAHLLQWGERAILPFLVFGHLTNMLLRDAKTSTSGRVFTSAAIFIMCFSVFIVERLGYVAGVKNEVIHFGRISPELNEIKYDLRQAAMMDLAVTIMVFSGMDLLSAILISRPGQPKVFFDLRSSIRPFCAPLERPKNLTNSQHTPPTELRIEIEGADGGSTTTTTITNIVDNNNNARTARAVTFDGEEQRIDPRVGVRANRTKGIRMVGGLILGTPALVHRTDTLTEGAAKQGNTPRLPPGRSRANIATSVRFTGGGIKSLIESTSPKWGATRKGNHLSRRDGGGGEPLECCCGEDDDDDDDDADSILRNAANARDIFLLLFILFFLFFFLILL